MKRKKDYGSLIVTGILVCLLGTQAQAMDNAEERALIEKTVASYVAAFNAGDAKTLAAHWSPEGVYTNPLTNESVTGKENILKEFNAVLAKEKKTQLKVSITSIEFISPNVALERGVAKVLRKDAEPEESVYSAVHVKREGRWLLDRISEEEVPVMHSNYEQLKGLEWMIGTWVDADDTGQVKTTCQWTRNKNFITRSFTVSVEDRIDMAGMQIIGWDPAKKQIRSWIFDSEGGFAEGVWKKNGKSWIVKNIATLPDGKAGSSTSIARPLDKDRFGWQKINRVVDGEILPNIDEIVVVRESE